MTTNILFLFKTVIFERLNNFKFSLMRIGNTAITGKIEMASKDLILAVGLFLSPDQNKLRTHLNIRSDRGHSRPWSNKNMNF